MLDTSATLLERLKEPGSPEWSRFVALYTPLIYHRAKRLGLGPDDAADLVQEVLAVAVRRMPTFEYRPTQSFRGWLHTVTRNQWRRSLRGRDPVAVGSLGDSEDPRADTPDAGEDREHARILVGRGLDLIRGEFSVAAWQAFEAHVLHARPAGEVAADLGLQLGTVYAAKSRVLARLRVALEGFVELD